MHNKKIRTQFFLCFLRRSLFLITLFLLPVQLALAKATQIPLSEQKRLSLTIYGNGLVLVKDKRSVPLQKGVNRLLLQSVSANILPNTALVRLPNSDTELRVLEQAFFYTPLSRESLFRATLGQTVSYKSPTSVKSGTLLTAEAPYLVRADSKIFTVLPDDLIVPAMPQSLVTQPTLEVLAQSTKTTYSLLELSYLTSGLEWRASYIGELDEKGSTIDLGGWVTLTNKSKTSYENALINLVAADSSWWKEDKNQGEQLTSQDEENTRILKAYRLYGSPIYSIEHPLNLDAGQVKQASLMREQNVPLEKSYHLYPQLSLTTNAVNKNMWQQVETWFSFKNNKVLAGAPLPRGKIRLYRRDERGNIQFVGKDTIPHTPVNSNVTLRLGNSQKVQAYLVQTDFKDLGRGTFEAGYRLVLKSSQTHPVRVLIKIPTSENMRLVKENITSDPAKSLNNMTVWDIPVEPKGQNELRFRFRLTTAQKK